VISYLLMRGLNFVSVKENNVEQTKKMAVIEERMQALDKIITKVATQVEVLQERLAPVLCVDLAESKNPSKKEGTQTESPLGEQLERFEGMVRRQQMLLDDMLHRLEI
jgi:hypothetical protein